MNRMRLVVWLVLVVVLLGALILPVSNSAGLNSKMLELTRQVDLASVSLCDYPDGLAAGLWTEHRRILLQHGIDAQSGRDRRMLALYSGSVFTDDPATLQAEYGLESAEFGQVLAGLALDCGDSPLSKRLAWAELAARHASGSEGTLVLDRVGRFYSRERMWPEARSAYEELIAREPSNGPVLQRLAVVYRALGEHELAVHALKSSLDDPEGDRIRSLVLLGNSYYQLGDHQAALAALGEAEQAANVVGTPNRMSHLIYFYQGLVWERTGQSGEAVRLYRTAVAFEPTHDASLVRLTRLLAAQGDFLGAEAYADQFSQAVRSSEPVLCLLLQVKAAAGRVKEVQDLQLKLDKLQSTCVVPTPSNPAESPTDGSDVD